MSGLFKRIAGAAAGFVMFALATSAGAQTLRTDLTLADLRTIFVTQQQYWALDDEQSATQGLNHLHITQLDTATGDFQGAINAPSVPTLGPPVMVVVPVTGKITVVPEFAPGTYPLGNYFTISFTWQYQPVVTTTQAATYNGAMMFLGYDGSGKMRGRIGGTVTSQYYAPTAPQFNFGPVPFSGQLAK